MAEPQRGLPDPARPSARRRALHGPVGRHRGRRAPAAGAGRARSRAVQPTGVAPRPRVRPRLPHPPRRAGPARRRAGPARPRRRPLPGSLRPHPAVVDVLRGRGAGRRRGGADLEDPPHGGRRHGCRPVGRGVPPADRRPAGAAAGRPRRRRERGGRARRRRWRGDRRADRLGARHRHPRRPAPSRDRPPGDERGRDVGSRPVAGSRRRRRRRRRRAPGRRPALAARARRWHRRRRDPGRVPALAVALTAPAPGTALVPAGRGAGRGQGAGRLAQRLVRDRRRQRGRAVPRRSAASRCGRSTPASS